MIKTITVHGLMVLSFSWILMQYIKIEIHIKLKIE